MIKALSHLVIVAHDVPHMTDFFQKAFAIAPHFTNEDFSDFVLPDKRRIAFFKPTGKAKDFFSINDQSENVSYGVTVENVDRFFMHLQSLKNKFKFSVSGEPKDHPWGEKSFLLIDVENNRWEITQSPSQDGHLVNIDFETN